MNNEDQGSFLRSDPAHDWRGRRIAKTIGAIGSGSPTNTAKFVYDNWNLVAVLDADLDVLTSFSWGLDLSGSEQGAGGVGGLLMVTSAGSGVTGFPCYDGNGNVMALVKAADGMPGAQYEYGPFGEVLRATGPLATVNPFRFSTKFQDEETEFLYYGYRYYDSGTGRWVSRDPIGERGGINLSAFGNNNLVSHIDPDGRTSRDDFPAPTSAKGECEKFEEWYQNEIKNTNWMKGLWNCPCTIKVRTTCSYVPIGAGGYMQNEEVLAAVSSDKDGGWALDSTVHVGAKWCMRSKPSKGGARQQCCFDQNGKLITHGTGAGTTDREAWLVAHFFADWLPVQWALRCDREQGNDVCVYKYLQVRPWNNGNNCPVNPPPRP